MVLMAMQATTVHNSMTATMVLRLRSTTTVMNDTKATPVPAVSGRLQRYTMDMDDNDSTMNSTRYKRYDRYDGKERYK